MTKAWLSRVWQLGLVSSLTIGSAIALSEAYVFAQIQPDSTLGSESSVVNPVDENSDRIDGGAIRDTNLFHSFQEFNVGEGKSVYFANPQAIENIFSRVTGNNPSQIQGLLGVLGDANLFLLNPNGIIFGENASLNVNGSFAATTANAVQFGSQGIFSATSPETPSLLTVNPTALLFNQINQNAAIANNSRVPAGKDLSGIDVFGLRVPDGKSLLLVGGNISMDGGWAIASGGRIELGGLTEAGSVGIQSDGNQFSLSFPEDVQRGDIFLNNKAVVNVIGEGGGSIAANAQNLEILAGSKFSAGIGLGLGTTNAQAGDITISTRNLIVKDSTLGSIVYGEGNAGDFKIIASDSVELSGEIPSDEKGLPGGILATLDVTGKGKSGNIYLETRRLSVSDGSKVQTATFGEGDAGNLFISANEIDVFETEKPNFYSTGIFATVGFDPRAVKPSKGNGGNLTIETRNLSIRDGGNIGVDTQGEGNGGQLFIKASDSIEVTGNFPYNSEISAGITDDRGVGNGGSITIETPKLTVKDGGIITSSTLGRGNAGNINIKTGSLSATNGSQINSFTSGQGNAGDITIQATDAVTFDGFLSNENNTFYTALFSSVDSGAVGNGGNINITAGSLSLTNSAKLGVGVDGALNTLPGGQGKGGTVNINVRDTLTISGSGSEISASLGADAVGSAGDIQIKAGNIFVKDGARINSFTSGQGNAGNIAIEAINAIAFDGKDSNGTYSALFNSVLAGGVGDGGKVDITVSSFSLSNGAFIDAGIREASDSLPGGKGNGSSVNINVRDVLTISGANTPGIFTSLGVGAVGSAGDIQINAGNLVIQDGGVIISSTFGQGDSGNISITADNSISLDASSHIVNNVQDIDAVGNAGKIDITTGSLSATNGSRINSYTRGQGNAGDITIQATDAVTFDGLDSNSNYSSSSSSVLAGGVGNGGNINITARSLSLTNGGELNVSVRAASDPLPGGNGKGGSVNINVDETLTIADGNQPGIFASLGNGAVGSGGDINIQAGNLVVQNGGEISSSTLGKGDSGNISITADNTISLDASSYIVNNVQDTNAVGNAGKIDITTGSLSATNGAQINSFTRGQGNGGNITIQATDTVTFDGVDNNRYPSGLNTNVEAGANGDGGTIKITTGSIFLTNLAEIYSDVDGRGNAGEIFIEARDLVSLVGRGDVNLGRNAFINTSEGSIISSGVNFGGEGKGGDITINAGSLRLDSSQINTGTAGKGDSGNIIINARDSVDLLQGSDMFSEVTCACEEQGGGVGGVGDGGDIKITTGSLLLDIGASLRADTEARGNGGNITINARDSVTFQSDISSLTGGALTQVEPQAVGQGGNIKITTGTLSISGYQEINTRTQGQGNAGNIDIQANSIFLAGSEVGIFSGASQEERLPGTLGNGGNISITADSLFINDGAKISADTEIIGNAGNIVITLSNILEARNGEISTSSTQSSGGAIKITAGDIKLRKDSDIRSNIFSGTGGGGNITLTADSVIAFDDSDILAFAQDGAGGNITLDTPAFFSSPPFRPAPAGTNPFSLDGNNRADINATGAISGVVTVPDVSFIQNSLTELPENPIDTNALIANSCIARRDRGGTFTVTGAGGLPNRPGDATVSPYPTGDVRGVESDRTSNNSDRRHWKIGDPIVEPQAAYRLADGQMVLSRECP